MVHFGIFEFFGGIAYWIWNGFKDMFSEMIDKLKYVKEANASSFFSCSCTSFGCLFLEPH